MPEMDTNGFHGDTFSGGFGNFHPAKRQLRTELPFSSAVSDFYNSKNSHFFPDQSMFKADLLEIFSKFEGKGG